ncbi:MAG: YitT family protein [Lutibacter sp.]|nr:YitT family protein [Lutibacter sp.]
MKKYFGLYNTKLMRKHILKSNIRDLVFISVGVIAASIGLKGFLFPNNFLDGGAMGVSLLLQILTGFNLSVLIVLINLPFIFLGAKQISVLFAIKSSLAILALAILVQIIQVPTITDDKLLIAVFGGFLLGAGIGFSIRGGAVLDGSEVLAISISRRSSLTVGDFIAIFNVCLFGLAGLIVSVETAMYSMLTYFSASKTVDFIINGIEEYIGVMIVSNDAELIKAMIATKLERGVTVFRSDGGYGTKGNANPDRKILFCVVTRLEVSRVLLEVDKIDQTAFVIQYPIKDTKGGMIKRRPFH